MSYLFPLGTATDIGQVQVGSNITVDANSIISIPQSVATTADLTFKTVNATTSLSVNGTPVVYKLIAGDNITLSATSGIVTIAATGEGIVTTVGVIANYTALATDAYIGVTVNPTIVTLPLGVTGKQYTIKNEATSGRTTVKGTGVEFIDASATKDLTSYASLTVVFRNGKWNVI
jgi:hypothetical protein